ncbi:chitobiase/beta-hexosaminidase C-terminal domain-containing protein [Methanosphaera cuniculi]|uniref:chitobiase/beta-hexosaminidase C-terminal domain-containing protein n=1 Tax=Methanosphaera cuniculi TaxID=1077256 RepID=UPI0026DB5575|nr:chitobiase/beta-hexosaminidase C-terminal domain-containing protein [Methanosphaera cuniculi]
MNTQVNAILIDKNGKVSQILKYQAPQIITLPIITVQILMPEDTYNNQKIYFDVNENQETYYTTDNSNPKNSSSRKIAKYPLSSPIDGINITNNTIVKYYTKDTLLGFQSDVYTYKPVKNKYEQGKITILNTTPLYKNGAENTKEEQKIKIQRNRYCPLETKQEEETYLIYTYNDKEFILNKTSNILIKEKNYENISSLWNHRILNYNITNGLKTRMSYTYTLQIRYQNIKISINSKTILNLKNTNLTNKYYLYDYNTKTYTITTNTTTTLNKPGTLIYLNDINNIIIKNYEYSYGETNLISIIKEGMGNNTIKVSAINNGIKNEICIIYIPNINQSITWNFVSNDFNTEDIRSEILNSEKIKNKEIESITTFVLTNQKTTLKIINEWMQKYSSYNKSVYKSAYGTFMTGLTYMYLYNSISTLLEYKLNLTTIVTRNTQMRVSIDPNGYTHVNSNDGYFGRTIIGENETNRKIYKFLSGFMGSYLEGVVLHLGGDKNAGSAAVYFLDDYFNNKTLQFEYNNQTNQVKITTENNIDYRIIISPNGGSYYGITASRTPQKTIKTSTNNENETNETIIYNELSGGHGTLGFGSKYESTATDNIVNFLNLALENLFEFGLNYTEHFINQTVQLSISVEKFLAKRKQQGVFNYLKEGTEDYLLQGGWNAFVETCGYEKL